MISDDDLYRLALFLGSAAMVLIVGYHYIEVNAKDDNKTNAQQAGKQGVVQKNTAPLIQQCPEYLTFGLLEVPCGFNLP
ncbi:hypothetical protein KVR01_009807 [Diaporthe batatas]|uniref:uncharacterized protein n=1 Tax=Diaporthe batatas TaxID=748121 RepID=UPI001D053744|nr:uncharacterized protein KVR01_009807 [Diaporthe batatas]KAG8160271.1 hypothetical protein KVR01_009807 [Diaporthe batatas]